MKANNTPVVINVDLTKFGISTEVCNSVMKYIVDSHDYFLEDARKWLSDQTRGKLKLYSPELSITDSNYKLKVISSNDVELYESMDKNLSIELKKLALKYNLSESPIKRINIKKQELWNKEKMYVINKLQKYLSCIIKDTVSDNVTYVNTIITSITTRRDFSKLSNNTDCSDYSDIKSLEVYSELDVPNCEYRIESNMVLNTIPNNSGELNYAQSNILKYAFDDVTKRFIDEFPVDLYSGKNFL